MATKTRSKPAVPDPITARLVEELDRVRCERGESKADVARGAGLGEPAVRRLLSGRHPNPTIRTLEAVAEHLGLQLAFERQPETRSAPTLAELRAKADEVERIVESHGGRSVRVFGSVARGDAHPASDVDLLVEVERGTGLLELGAMEDELELVLGRRVDVVTSGHGPMKHIHDEAVPLR